MTLLKTPPPSSGTPSSLPNIWNAFVTEVIRLTIQAYRELRQNGEARQDWEEDTFTINLEDSLRPILFSHPLNLQIKTRVPVYTPRMKGGKSSPKEAKIIDIQCWGQWDQYDKIYFAWECKLMADPSNRVYKDLPNEYIKEGIFRFIDGKYSSGLSDAGMLAYVLEGSVLNILKSINSSITGSRRVRKLAVADKLTKSSSVDGFEDIYTSQHSRVVDSSRIRLHHLFLTFDF